MSAEPKKGALTRRIARIKLGKPYAMGGDALVNYYRPGEELPAALWEPRVDDKGHPLHPEAEGWREGVHFQTVAA